MRSNADYCRFVGLAVILAILGVAMGGCATRGDDTARAPRDPNVVERADSSEAVGGARLPPDALGSGKLPIRSVAEQERVTLSAGAKKGKELLNGLGCLSCHRIHGQGGTVGPDLSNEGTKGRSRDWLATQIRNPGAHNPQTVMPSFDKLSDEQVNKLVDYLRSLSTERD